MKSFQEINWVQRTIGLCVILAGFPVAGMYQDPVRYAVLVIFGAIGTTIILSDEWR